MFKVINVLLALVFIVFIFVAAVALAVVYFISEASRRLITFFHSLKRGRKNESS